MHRTTRTSAYLCPQTRMTEFASSVFALWWTVLLLLPVELFHSNSVFVGLQRISSQHGWVLGTATTFIVQALGWRSGSPVLRWCGCMLAGLLWIFVTAGIYLGSIKWHIVVPVSTGIAAYGATGAVNLYCAAFVLSKYVLPEIYAAHTSSVTHLYIRFVAFGEWASTIGRKAKGG